MGTRIIRGSLPKWCSCLTTILYTWNKYKMILNSNSNLEIKDRNKIHLEYCLTTHTKRGKKPNVRIILPEEWFIHRLASMWGCLEYSKFHLFSWDSSWERRVKFLPVSSSVFSQNLIETRKWFFKGFLPAFLRFCSVVLIASIAIKCQSLWLESKI